ncbi:FAD-dependent monooxygenase [Spirillospora sp. CA-128828]|uniref:FAD-dependent monooxygenase n=1 Tax=Spirillospora sp. CA-128828 TaxID=3240033 RepID=UPI003D94AA77
MSECPQYDVAVIGYGPTGVTAANLLGALGVSVVVVERDASVYGRARTISTDEEVMRVWQEIGLAERLKRDMLPDRPIDFVDAGGRSFISAVPTPRGQGHPPQMFIYQPALERTLREGVERYPNVDVQLEHECLRVSQDDQGVELLIARSGQDRLTRVRASYVIAADGGSSPTRGQLGVGFEGRTYEDRWPVIDTELVKEWPGHDRLRFHCDPDRPAVDCPTPLGHHRWEFPVLPGEDEKELVTDAAVWRLLDRQGITGEHVSVLRGVERLWRFPGPKGITQEIFTRPRLASGPPALRTGGFVTGEDGMGHIALTSTRPARLRGYFTTVFDARLTDYIDETISGVKLRSVSCGSTAAITPSRSPPPAACAWIRSAPASSTSTSRSPKSTT